MNGLPPAIKIKLHGKTLFIREDDLGNCEGPIMTAPDSDVRLDMSESYAHLYPEGIMRFNSCIGTRDDIEVVGPRVEVN